MLRGAPPAAGPTGTVGRARATPELHDSVQRGTVGRGLNQDHRPCTGRGSYASMHAHRGTAGRETIQNGLAGCERAGGAARELRVDACASRHRRPRDHSWDRGPYAGRRSCAARSGPNVYAWPLRVAQLLRLAHSPRCESPCGSHAARAGSHGHGADRHVSVSAESRSSCGPLAAHCPLRVPRPADVHASTRTSTAGCGPSRRSLSLGRPTGPRPP
jgi:hypothetical protein